MMGFTFPGVKYRDAIKHIQSNDYKSRFDSVRKSGRVEQLYILLTYVGFSITSMM